MTITIETATDADGLVPTRAQVEVAVEIEMSVLLREGV